MFNNIIDKINNTVKNFLSLSVAGITDTGLQRENNEDNFYINKETGFFIVSDGMGGVQGGDIASELVVTKLPESLADYTDTLLPESSLTKSLIEVNEYVCDYTSEREEIKGAGATVVTCLIRDEKAFIGHVGDSRAYLLRDNKFSQLTEDHSVVNHLIKNNIITKEEAQNSSARHQITQCIGMKTELLPGMKIIDLYKGDKILLCTDGLTEMLSDEVIGQILIDEPDLDAACRNLIDRANSAGGKDNITAVIIRYGTTKIPDDKGEVQVLPLKHLYNN